MFVLYDVLASLSSLSYIDAFEQLHPSTLNYNTVSVLGRQLEQNTTGSECYGTVSFAS